MSGQMYNFDLDNACTSLIPLCFVLTKQIMVDILPILVRKCKGTYNVTSGNAFRPLLNKTTSFITTKYSVSPRYLLRPSLNKGHLSNKTIQSNPKSSTFHLPKDASSVLSPTFHQPPRQSQ